MAIKLSPARERVPIIEGLKLLHRGKVRDTYEIDNEHLLIVATDAVSIFDFTLNTLIPQKGIILNAMSHFWFSQFSNFGIAHHCVATGPDVRNFLPDACKDDLDLLCRSMVVRKLNMYPVEFIARGYLTGSGLSAYEKTGSICGHMLPRCVGLGDGSLLPFILDTPTTKSEEGHDEHLNARNIRIKYHEQTYLLIKLFQLASQIAWKRGIILADTKLEFGHPGDSLAPTVGDEVFTPDSSRFWDRTTWEKMQSSLVRKSPPSLDKQLIRNWGISIKMNERKPESPEDVQWVHEQVVPPELIKAAQQTYRYIFWRLTDHSIESYCKEKMGIEVAPKKKRVVIVLGSRSDLSEVSERITFVRNTSRNVIESIRIHVISCHRNPDELRDFVGRGCDDADVIIAAGGKAFALPGVLDALIASSNQTIPVIGVALGDNHTKAGQAALLSIDELPGQPVIMDERNGEPYHGAQGVKEALWRIGWGELPPPKVREKKTAEFDISLDET